MLARSRRLRTPPLVEPVETPSPRHTGMLARSRRQRTPPLVEPVETPSPGHTGLRRARVVAEPLGRSEKRGCGARERT